MKKGLKLLDGPYTNRFIVFFVLDLFGRKNIKYC